MKKKIIALISGAVILIIAAESIYGKSESGHKEGEDRKSTRLNSSHSTSSRMPSSA